MGDTDEFRYSTLGDGDDAKAGVMDAAAFLPEGVPAHWSVYLRVADADATIAAITEHGGSVVMPAEDTPTAAWPRVADPTGATLQDHGPTNGLTRGQLTPLSTSAASIGVADVVEVHGQVVGQEAPLGLRTGGPGRRARRAG